MNVIEWLCRGDDTVQRLTKKYLCDEPVDTQDSGFIKRHLDAFDSERALFGGGLYGPKWISTQYTLLELVDMEADPNSAVFQSAVHTLRNRLWPKWMKKGVYHIDLCIAGMLLKVFSYAKTGRQEAEEIIDYIMMFQMRDGGWNCRLEGDKKPNCSSVHTTINVLEGLLAYTHTSWQYKKNECVKAMESGSEVLLERQLFHQKGTNIPLQAHMTKAHFPPRWKYDYLRALVWFADKKHPADERMKPAFELLYKQMEKGRMLRGTAISGKRRFSLENEHYGRFNTLRALKVLKQYDQSTYDKIIAMSIAE